MLKAKIEAASRKFLNSNDEQKVNFLKALAMFQGWDSFRLGLLAYFGRLLALPAGEVIINSNKSATHVFILLTGDCESFAESMVLARRMGDSVRRINVGTGCVFGAVPNIEVDRTGFYKFTTVTSSRCHLIFWETEEFFSQVDPKDLDTVRSFSPHAILTKLDPDERRKDMESRLGITENGSDEDEDRKKKGKNAVAIDKEDELHRELLRRNSLTADFDNEAFRRAIREGSKESLRYTSVMNAKEVNERETTLRNVKEKRLALFLSKMARAKKVAEGKTHSTLLNQFLAATAEIDQDSSEILSPVKPKSTQARSTFSSVGKSSETTRDGTPGKSSAEKKPTKFSRANLNPGAKVTESGGSILVQIDLKLSSIAPHLNAKEGAAIQMLSPQAAVKLNQREEALQARYAELRLAKDQTLQTSLDPWSPPRPASAPLITSNYLKSPSPPRYREIRDGSPEDGGNTTLTQMIVKGGAEEWNPKNMINFNPRKLVEETIDVQAEAKKNPLRPADAEETHKNYLRKRPPKKDMPAGEGKGGHDLVKTIDKSLAEIKYPTDFVHAGTLRGAGVFQCSADEILTAEDALLADTAKKTMIRMQAASLAEKALAEAPTPSPEKQTPISTPTKTPVKNLLAKSGVKSPGEVLTPNQKQSTKWVFEGEDPSRMKMKKVIERPWRDPTKADSPVPRWTTPLLLSATHGHSKRLTGPTLENYEENSTASRHHKRNMAAIGIDTKEEIASRHIPGSVDSATLPLFGGYTLSFLRYANHNAEIQARDSRKSLRALRRNEERNKKLEAEMFHTHDKGHLYRLNKARRPLTTPRSDLVAPVADEEDD